VAGGGHNSAIRQMDVTMRARQQLLRILITDIVVDAGPRCSTPSPPKCAASSPERVSSQRFLVLTQSGSRLKL